MPLTNGFLTKRKFKIAMQNNMQGTIESTHYTASDRRIDVDADCGLQHLNAVYGRFGETDHFRQMPVWVLVD